MEALLDNKKEEALKLMIDEGKINQFLYKYRSDSTTTEIIIKEKTLWFAHPNEFNDPFDCWVNVADVCSDELNSFIESNCCDNYYGQICKKGISSFDKESLKKIVDDELSKIGVCSFSKTKSDILMWSHYADYHKGLCLEFDVLEDCEFFTLAKFVDYKSQMPEYNHFKESDKLIEKIIQPKAECWRYEQEVRIIKTPNDIIQNNNNQAFRFNPKSLKKIIFGCKTKTETIERYKLLCKESGLDGVKFSKMYQSNDGNFKLNEDDF